MTTNRWGVVPFTLHLPSGGALTLAVGGRVRWALEALIAAGPKGCTPITMPGPRWSHYVFRLRREGVDVETIHEPHGGPFAGKHGRYVLRSQVTPACHRRAA